MLGLLWASVSVVARNTTRCENNTNMVQTVKPLSINLKKLIRNLKIPGELFGTVFLHARQISLGD